MRRALSTPSLSTMMTTPLLMQTLLDRGPRIQADNLIITKTRKGYHEIDLATHSSRAKQLASALRNAGVGFEDRVGTLMYNNARHLSLYHAVPCMGAVLHTLNVRLGLAELGYIIQHAQDKVIVVDAELLPRLNELDAAAIASVELVVVCGVDEQTGGWSPSTLGDQWASKTVVDFEEFVEHESSFSWPLLDENSAMGLCYTSGTTGKPKGVMYSHRSTYLHTMASATTDAYGLSGRDVMLPVVPMFHAMAWGIPFISLMLGSRICLTHSQTDPKDIMQTAVDLGVTFSSGVPTIWQGVRSALENADDETRSKFCVERVLCGGSGVPSDLMEFFLSRYKTQFFQGWGMTELSPNGSVGRLDVKREHASWTREEQFSNVQKAGLLHPGLEARIIDVNCGSCCSHNELVVEDGVASGELIIRGPYVTQEYFNHPTSTEDAFVDLNDGGSTWLRTGDIASIDAGGTIEISDRAKDLIKSGGEWISSADIEKHASAHQGLQVCAVVGRTHPKWDERPIVVAVAVADEGASVIKSADELLKEIREHLTTKGFARYELPDDLVLWNKMPLTGTGKLDKKAVRKLLDEENYILPSLRKGA